MRDITVSMEVTPKDVGLLNFFEDIDQFQNQIDNIGFSLVEILSPCPIYWDMPPDKALDWIKEVMMKEFPLGRIK